MGKIQILYVWTLSNFFFLTIEKKIHTSPSATSLHLSCEYAGKRWDINSGL